MNKQTGWVQIALVSFPSLVERRRWAVACDDGHWHIVTLEPWWP